MPLFPPGPYQRRSIKPHPAFTLIELLVVIAIISVLIAILVPALSRAREIGKRTVCGSNLRQIATAMISYTDNNNGWFPAKPHPTIQGASVKKLATVQNKAFGSLSNPNRAWGPNFAGMVRDIMEWRHTREKRGAGTEAAPTYIREAKVLICPSDLENNPPELNTPSALVQLWPTQSVKMLRELPRSQNEEINLKKSYSSYVYVSLLRSDDRGDFMLMSEQTNYKDTGPDFLRHGFDYRDNHGTRGVNAMFVDSHVEWRQLRDGSVKAAQDLAWELYGPFVVAKPRYPDKDNPPANRSEEIQTIE